VPITASAILVILLIIAAIYVANNYDELTKWLAKPTLPQFLTPFNFTPNSSPAQATVTNSSNSSPSNQPVSTGTSSSTSPADTPSNTTIPQSVKTPPAISDFQIASISAYGATVSWKTSVPCTGKVIYQTGTNEPLTQDISGDPTASHKTILMGLESGKNYTVTVQSRDAEGNTVSKGNTFQTLTLRDEIPPMVVESPSITVTDSTATVSWKTNEPVISKIMYGSDTNYEFSSSYTPKLSTDSSIFLSSLASDTIYHYQLISTDEAGNTMNSKDYNFKTETLSGAAPYLASKAPNFKLKSLDGSEVSLTQFRGKKIILNFWASWCTPCKIEMPHFQAFWDKYRNAGDVVIISVAGSESDESVIRAFAAESNIDFIICMDNDDDLFNRYSIVSIPKTFFIDKSGVIRKIQQGMFTGPGEIEFMLSSLQ